MTRIDGPGPMQTPEMHRPNSTRTRTSRRVADGEEAREVTRDGRSDADDTTGLHNASNLRRAVEKLVQSGDLDATSDGRVREGRVAQARQKTVNGAYSDQSVLSDVVDRLLQQWEI